MVLVLETLSQSEQQYWLQQLEDSAWDSGQRLAQKIHSGVFYEQAGPLAQVLLLVDEMRLVAYATYVSQDNIEDSGFTPWIGYVYTAPAYRGLGKMKELLLAAEAKAKADGYAYTYISTGHVGLYEQAGYTYVTSLTDYHGASSRIYRKALS